MKCFTCDLPVAGKDKIVCVSKSCAHLFHLKCLTEQTVKKQVSTWHCESCKSFCCFACNAPTEVKERINCATCPYIYHYLCVGLTATSSKINWSCPNCKKGLPKQDNTNTPLRAPVASISNVTIRKTQPAQEPGNTSPFNGDLRSFIEVGNQSLKQSNHSELRFLAKFARIEAGVARISDLETELLQAKNRITELESLHANQLKTTHQQLETATNIQHQYNLRNELEIAGVPEVENENLQHTVMLISKKIGVDVSASDVDEITRAGPKRPKTTKPIYEGMPRLIIVKLVRRDKRSEFLKAANARRNLTSEGIVGVPSKQLYFNERLTKENRLLFRDARLRARQHGFRYCWVRDGAIYVRLADKKAAVQIKTSNDLASVIGLPLPVDPPHITAASASQRS